MRFGLLSFVKRHSDPAQSRLIEIAWGLSFLLLATLIRLSLEPWLHNRGSYGMFFMAAICAAWFAGWLSGTFTLFVGALVGTSLFAQGGLSRGDDPGYLIGLFVYLSIGEIIVSLVSAQLYQRRRADRNAMEASSRREWLDAVLSSIGDAVIVIDMQERVIEMNRVAEWLTGWSADESAGRYVVEIAKLIGEETSRTAEHSVFDPLSSDSSVTSAEPTLLVTRDGRRIAVDLRRTMIHDGAGRVSGHALAIRDETERRSAERALRESEANFRDLADNISQFAWMADETGAIFWYNQRWFDYTGTTLEAVRGWGWKAVHHPDYLDRVVAGFQHSIDTGEPWEDTFPLRSKNGEYRWFLSRAQAVRDEHGHVVRWFGTNTDITDQQRLEEALRDADRRKNEYLAILAHELRNPLAAVRSTIDALRLAGDDAAFVGKSTDDLTRQMAQVVRVIDDLLDVSRIGHGKITLRRRLVTLDEVVRTALAIGLPLIEEKSHKFTMSLPDKSVWLDADPVRMAQALSNVMINAAKYTDRGGQISLKAELYGTDVVVRIKDNGVGLNAGMLTRVFEPFQQVRSTMDRTQGGLGLGLTLVKSLVELHGGKVSAHSEGLGKGSEFLIRLPIVQQTVAAEEEPRGVGRRDPVTTDKSRPHRILIADDNHEAASSLARVVRLLGHDVRVVFDGLAAKEALLTDTVDVAILDIGMPKLSGHEVAREVRKARSADETLLVALTGWGKPEDREQSHMAGFDHHLVKPVELDALRSILERTAVPAGSAR